MTAATVRKRCSPAVLIDVPYSTRTGLALRESRLASRGRMVFSQLSGHDPSHVALFILPRLFNERERLPDAPEPLEGLRAQDGDAAGIGGDGDNDVGLDLDVHRGPLPGWDAIEQLQATLC